MDSQFISILIGIGFVVGLPLLEKFVEKVRRGSQPQRPVTPPRQRPQYPRPPQPQQQMPRPQMPQMRQDPIRGVPQLTNRRQQRRPAPPRQQPVSPVMPAMPVEGERVTEDRPQTIQPAPAPRHVSPVIDDLSKAIIWSEILNNPKFKEF